MGGGGVRSAVPALPKGRGEGGDSPRQVTSRAILVFGSVLFVGGVAVFFAARPSPGGGPSTASVLPAVEPGRLGLIGTLRF